MASATICTKGAAPRRIPPAIAPLPPLPYVAVRAITCRQVLARTAIPTLYLHITSLITFFFLFYYYYWRWHCKQRIWPATSSSSLQFVI